MNILLDAKGTYLARQCAIAFQHLESGMLTETDQKFLNGSESDGNYIELLKIIENMLPDECKTYARFALADLLRNVNNELKMKEI